MCDAAKTLVFLCPHVIRKGSTYSARVNLKRGVKFELQFFSGPEIYFLKIIIIRERGQVDVEGQVSRRTKKECFFNAAREEQN